PSPTPTPSPSPSPTPTPSPSPSPTPTPASTPSPTPQLPKVTLPTDSFDTSVSITTVITEPVVVTNVNPSLNIVGFQGDFTFDSNIVSFSSPYVNAAGLTAGTWTVAANVLNSGPGTTKTLRISAFVNDGVTPLSGSGTLFTMRMLR